MSLIRVCAISRAERIARWVAAIFVAAIAGSAATTGVWALAIPAAFGALILGAMAITGWCPGMPATRSADAAPNALGIPEARQSVDLD
ncbi:YgaP-like transmembrane domain [Microbacterium sp. NPDC076895]|uniref:YgaP-like transmembrane domain n=1 Tax=Microbacterium sp. NPDC076895 TaxID=3154957 RepID=UPI00341ED49C